MNLQVELSMKGLKSSYDLHCHSDQSDGILSPEALVSRAKASNVEVLALTDHDTTAGIARAAVQAEKEGLTLIPGCEFSCQWSGRNIHIVALNFDRVNPAFTTLLQRQGERREQRSRLIAEKLAKVGFDDAYEAAQRVTDGAVIGRPHFAKAMVEAGFVRSVDQAFKRYLGNGKVGDVKQLWPDVESVIQTIVAAGGSAVLAHPLKYNMTLSKLNTLLDNFCEAGGQAMEVISGAQTRSELRDMVRVAKRFGLFASCGSDFHAPGQRWTDLGNIPALPDDVVPVWTTWSC